MIIQLTSSNEIRAIAQIENLCFPDPWSDGAFATALESESCICLSALEDEKVVGYIFAFYAADSADITNIATSPEYRRRGIARELMKACEEELARRGVCDIYLEVRPSNIGAATLYIASGYKAISVRRNYYKKPREDAIVMKKVIC
jgi:ribosomal-protein-alanine N-acetyltransferase